MTLDTTKEPRTIEQFEQDLTELASSYNEALANDDERTKGIIFEMICKLGADQLYSMKEDPLAAEKIKAAIEKLEICGPKETLFASMMGYGYQESVSALMSTPMRSTKSAEHEPFDKENFRADFIRMLTETNVIRMMHRLEAFTKHQENVTYDSYQQMVRRIADMPPFQQKLALEIAEECFASTEEELKVGPLALRKAGIRSFIAFHREVRASIRAKRAGRRD